MDSISALPNDPHKLIHANLAAIVHFQRTTCGKTTVMYSEDQRMQQFQVRLIKRNIQENGVVVPSLLSLDHPRKH